MSAIHRVRCSGTSDHYRVGSSGTSDKSALTCVNKGQGQEGQVIQKVPSRTRVTRAQTEVSEHLTLLTLRGSR